MVTHLRRLGVTAIELLPIHALVHDRPLVERGLSNYWGYNTLAIFAPEPRYLASGEPDELKGAIKALHAAGIEVLLDVVYNHTCEGSELGPTLSLRGLDNAGLLSAAAARTRATASTTPAAATPSTFSHPRVIQLTLDSLRYWVAELSRRRFPLRSERDAGARSRAASSAGAGFFDALMQDPVLSKVKLIAEPWDMGPDGFQLGNHPTGMAEWNVALSRRRAPRLARRLRRCAAHWRRGCRDRPTCSITTGGARGRRINFITAHDGFTLQDWVSYNHKHNEANGEDNRDGSDDNASNNWGVEGPTEDAAMHDAARTGQARDAGDAAVLARHADAARRRRVRPAPRAATTTPTARIPNSPGSTGRGRSRRRASSSSTWSRACCSCGASTARCAAVISSMVASSRCRRCATSNGSTRTAISCGRRIGSTPKGGCCACGGRARIDAQRAEVSLLLINTTGDAHAFQLPQPRVPLDLAARHRSRRVAGPAHRAAAARSGAAQPAVADRGGRGAVARARPAQRRRLGHAARSDHGEGPARAAALNGAHAQAAA